jgi:ABC-type polysaccharide/polyol phosphate export permease
MQLTGVSDNIATHRREHIFTSGWRNNIYVSQLRELYRYRSLTWNLVARELKARYRGSMLGFLWSFLNPLLLMSVYALVFSVFMRWGMENYVVFLISGLLPWIWFSSSLLDSSGSIIGGGNLIKKVLFPAEVLPLVVVLSNFINFLLSLPIILLFAIIFKRPITGSLLALPVVMLVQMVLLFGLGLLFSALCVHYRDIQHILGNFLTLWFFLTPVIYPLEQVEARGAIVSLPVICNPVTPLVLAYQRIFFYGEFPDFGQLVVIAVLAVLVYLLGASIFERHRITFAEEV